MKRFFLFSLLLSSALSASSLLGHQENRDLNADPGFRPGPVQHLVFGDLIIDESAAPAGAPQNFTVSLNSSTGLPFGRDSVAPRGRFRFQNIPNGEYTLVVEADGKVLYRERFILQDRQSTDVRKDVELVWQAGGLASGAEAGGYPRSGDNQKLFEESRRAASGGDLKKGAALLEKVTKADEQDFEAWTELGTLYFRQDDYKKAEKAYEKAVEAKPDFAVALSNLGKLHLAQKKYEEAATTLEAALQIEPERAELHRFVGEAYLGMKKGSVAVGYLEKAIELDPEGMAEVHLRLAQLYDLAGYKELAAREYSRFLVKRPDDARKKDLEKYIQEHGQ